MTWTGVDDFTYTDGDLNGKNGGSGWTGAWSGDTAIDITSNEVAIVNPAGGNHVTRSVSSATSADIVKIQFKQSFTGNGGMQIAFKTGGTYCGIIRAVSTPKVQLFDNVTLRDIESASFSVSTYYYLYFEYDCGTDQYRAKIGSAPSGTWYAFYGGGTATTIDTLEIWQWDSYTGTVNYDNLGDGSGSPPSTAIKDIISMGLLFPR